MQKLLKIGEDLTKLRRVKSENYFERQFSSGAGPLCILRETAESRCPFIGGMVSADFVESRSQGLIGLNRITFRSQA